VSDDEPEKTCRNGHDAAEHMNEKNVCQACRAEYFYRLRTRSKKPRNLVDA
jgi:hypothetical protein